MGITVARVADSLPAPLVVLYHTGASADLLAAWPEASFISETHPGFKNWYTHLSSQDGLATIDDLIGAAGMTRDDVTHLVLVGFSEGTQGVRTQMLAGEKPSAVIAVDGIHTKPEAWADIIARARDMSAAATITHSSIKPGTYASTTQIAANILAPDIEQPVDPDSSKYPMIGYFQDGYFRVVGYAGDDAGAHVYQAQHVLPMELAVLRDELNGVAPEHLTSHGSSTLVLAGILGLTALGVWYVLRKR